MAETRNKRKSSVTHEGLTAPKKLKVLFTIVERSKTDFYLDILEGFDVNLQMVFYGEGTAPTNIAQVLGKAPEKAVILSVVREDHIKEILNAYEDKYFKTRNGRGIAFTVPLSSVIGKMNYEFMANLGSKE